MTSTTQDESNNPATESEISKNIRRGKKQEQRNVAQDGPIIPKFAKIFFEKAGGEPLPFHHQPQIETSTLIAQEPTFNSLPVFLHPVIEPHWIEWALNSPPK